MQITLLKSKIHRAIVTSTHLDYEGSCAIDETLLTNSDIKEFEMLHIYNINNGNRFTTYAIKAKSNSGIISLNGAAAHKAKKNDLITICTYASFEKTKINTFKPKLIYLKKETNIIDRIGNNIATQNSF